MKSWYEPGLHKCPQLHIRSPDTPLHVLHQATNEQKQVLQNDTGQACIDSKGTRKMVLETYILSRSMLKVYIFPCNFRDMSKDKLTMRKVSNSWKEKGHSSFSFHHSSLITQFLSLITHHLKHSIPFGTITHLSSLNIFQLFVGPIPVPCAAFTFFSFFFSLQPPIPKLTKPSEKKKEKEKKPNSPNPVKKKEKKKK